MRFVALDTLGSMLDFKSSSSLEPSKSSESGSSSSSGLKNKFNKNWSGKMEHFQPVADRVMGS